MRTTMQTREEQILLAAYGMEQFTLNDVTTAVALNDGHNWYSSVQQVIRARVKSGQIVQVNQGSRPFLYRWADDT